MLRTHPQPVADGGPLAECVEACYECAQTCTACADACLGETDHLAMLVRCVRLDLDCADVCDATGRVLSRAAATDDGVRRALVAACAEACRACGDECERHAAMHAHCRVCAEACRRCEAACRALAA